MTREVDGSAFTAAARSLADFDDEAAAALAPALDRMGDAVAEGVRARARRHRRTGRLERSITVRATGSGAKRQVVVRADDPVAHLITGGTVPHVIYARARPIPLPGRSFAERVRHPGTAADPFFDRGVDDADPDLDRITGRLADELQADLAADLGGR